MNQIALERRISAELPRLFTALDRNSFSKSFGSFDRNWWHYKAGTSFSGATYQQGVLVLALLYKYGGFGFPAGSQEVLDWISAGMKFWAGIQHRDGSFPEWYPAEHSFVATAFTTYAISESFLELNKELDLSIKEVVRDALRKAGHWLAHHDDLVVSNHQAGKIAALGNLSQIFKDSLYRDAAGRGLERLVRVQHAEGWFPEYGGADPAYQSVTCDYLAKYYSRTQDRQTLGPLKRGIEFLVFFLHPDGTFGGNYGARNAQYLMTHGLQLVSREVPEAAYLLHEADRRGSNQIPWFPQGADERYLIFFFLPNMIQTYFSSLSFDAGVSQDFQPPSERWFEGAGLFVYQNPRYWFLCNLKKGGVYRVYNKKDGQEDTLNIQDGGFFVRTEKGALLATQCFNKKARSKADFSLKSSSPGKYEIQVRTSFFRVNEWQASITKQLALLLWGITFGRVGSFRKLFDKGLKRALVQKRRKTPLFLDRTIRLGENTIEVVDKITQAQAFDSIQHLGRIRGESVQHIPSARNFIPEEGFRPDGTGDQYSPDELNKKKQVQIRIEHTFSRTYGPNPKHVTMKH
jgi:hypothetical protein